MLLIVGAAALLAALFYRDNPLTQRAQDYAQTVSVASAGIYVSLRTVNAFLSAAQEVEVGGALVVQGTVQPLKTLEPIDDTIERIASLVFTTMVVTGLLAVAMGPVSAVGAALICGALALWIADRLIGRQDIVVVMARRLSWYGAFLAVALPLAFLLSALVADHLTGQVWEDNTAIVAEITAPIDLDETDTDSGFWAVIDTAEDYRDLARNVYDRADDLIGSYIAILAVFLFKILVLPLMLVGAFFIVVRFFAQRPQA
ncbi:MAG: hypothetical protein AB3N23_05370 [Paracoccaceae bacterium]